MKIYLVYRIDEVRYDEYDSWVVVAKNPKEAISLCKWYVNDPQIKVKEIKPGKKTRTILGSFNAG